jgi:hypothetical protein
MYSKTSAFVSSLDTTRTDLPVRDRTPCQRVGYRLAAMAEAERRFDVTLLGLVIAAAVPIGNSSGVFQTTAK